MDNSCSFNGWTSHCNFPLQRCSWWGQYWTWSGDDFPLPGCGFPVHDTMVFTDRTSLSLKGKRPAHLRVGLSQWSNPWEALGSSLTVPVYFPEERLWEVNKITFWSVFIMQVITETKYSFESNNLKVMYNSNIYLINEIFS